MATIQNAIELNSKDAPAYSVWRQCFSNGENGGIGKQPLHRPLALNRPTRCCASAWDCNAGWPESVDDAVVAYGRAIELNPQRAPSYYARGSTLHRQGKLDEAITAYRKAIELNPDDAVTHYAVSWHLNINAALRSRYAELSLLPQNGLQS